MTAEPVSIEDLATARESLIQTVVGKMPEQHRRFLLSFERGKPEWSLLDLPGASDLPAVRWRRENLDKLKSGERAQLVSKLEAVDGRHRDRTVTGLNPSNEAISFGNLRTFPKDSVPIPRCLLYLLCCGSRTSSRAREQSPRAIHQ